MKRGSIGTTKETLCWSCKNCTRCSWADGIPVKGWTATPTVVHDHDGDYNSYLVTKCPYFKEDTKRGVTGAEIAQILGRTRGAVARALRAHGSTVQLRGQLRGKGYKLHIYKVPCKNGKERREFILERLDRKE